MNVLGILFSIYILLFLYQYNYYTRIIKTFPVKMKEDGGMSKPKKHANKVRWDLKLNKPLPYSTA